MKSALGWILKMSLVSVGFSSLPSYAETPGALSEILGGSIQTSVAPDPSCTFDAGNRPYRTRRITQREAVAQNWLKTLDQYYIGEIEEGGTIPDSQLIAEVHTDRQYSFWGAVRGLSRGYLYQGDKSSKRYVFITWSFSVANDFELSFLIPKHLVWNKTKSSWVSVEAAQAEVTENAQKCADYVHSFQ